MRKGHIMKKKKILLILLVVLVVILISIIGIGSNYLVDFALTRESSSTEAIADSLWESQDEQAKLEQKAKELEDRLKKEADTWSKEYPAKQYSITSYDGLKLVADYYEQEINAGMYCIFLHGYKKKKEDIRLFAKHYYELGYNVLTPDMRSHGESEGEYIGMGYLDKDDLKQWIDFIIEKDPEAQIALHGLSMGASTIMMASGEDLPENVKVMVEDSGYSGVWEEFADKLKSVYGLPEFPMLYGANIISGMKAGYYFSDGDAVAPLRKNDVPMLFIHGDKDDYNPFYMLDIVYEANASEKKKLVIPGARHVMGVHVDAETYWNTVDDFLNQYMQARVLESAP